MSSAPIKILIASILVLAALFFLFQNAFAATSYTQNVSASATVNSYVETSVNSSSLAFGNLDPSSVNNFGGSIRLTNTANSNTAIDVYLNGSNFTSGANHINNTNFSIATSAGGLQTNFTQSAAGVYTYLNGSGPDAGYREDLAVAGTFDIFFYLDVPPAQTAGAYTSGVNIRTVANGGTP